MTKFGALPESVIFRDGSMMRTLAIWLSIGTLAWTPFPLGGAIAWASGLQTMLIAACCLLWIAGKPDFSEFTWKSNRVVAVPLCLAVFALGWAVVQILPGVAGDWLHPIWRQASEILAKPLPAYISINPWRTEAEITKLASYVMAAWLAFRMARDAKTAELLLNSVIVIGTFYALYAFILDGAGLLQTGIFYSVHPPRTFLSGPFMLHNSFATYCGLVVMAAVAKLFAMGSSAIVVRRGSRRFIETALQFCFARGSLVLGAVLVTFAGVVASASRAGFASTMCGLVTAAVIVVALVRGRSTIYAGIGAFAAAAPLLALVIMNGGSLGHRIGDLFSSDAGDAVRFSLWAAAEHMISSSPWLGLGLGTFEDAYPMYATRVFPLVMDKAHCDYLEFAAGIGLPAAIAWWSAIIWATTSCVQGVRRRHRNRYFCVVAASATAVVAVHSCADFSLQLPSIALLYATLLGIGLAQSLSSRQRAREDVALHANNTY